jgi:hypothetical protein
MLCADVLRSRVLHRRAELLCSELLRSRVLRPGPGLLLLPDDLLRTAEEVRQAAGLPEEVLQAPQELPRRRVLR